MLLPMEAGRSANRAGVRSRLTGQLTRDESPLKVPSHNRESSEDLFSNYKALTELVHIRL